MLIDVLIIGLCLIGVALCVAAVFIALFWRKAQTPPSATAPSDVIGSNGSADILQQRKALLRQKILAGGKGSDIAAAEMRGITIVELAGLGR